MNLVKTGAGTDKGLKIFAGDRLRRLRLGRGSTQSGLARELAVSPSYLSQIEADLRPVPPALRARIAALFGVPESHFADDKDELRAASLREASGDPLFRRTPISRDEARAAVRASPDVAERFLALYRAYLALDEQHQALRDRVSVEEEFTSKPHFPYDEVRDWVQSRWNHFERLDHAAESLADQAGFGAATLREDLAGHLRDRHALPSRTIPACSRTARFGGCISSPAR